MALKLIKKSVIWYQMALLFVRNVIKIFILGLWVDIRFLLKNLILRNINKTLAKPEETSASVSVKKHKQHAYSDKEER